MKAPKMKKFFSGFFKQSKQSQPLEPSKSSEITLTSEKTTTHNTKEVKASKPSKLIKYEPTNFSESRIIAKEIINGNVIVLDITNTQKQEAIRIIDLISGTLLAINGDYRKLAPMIFLISPSKELGSKYQEVIAMRYKKRQQQVAIANVAINANTNVNSEGL